MRKLKLFFACLLMAVLSIGQVWGADPSVKSTFSTSSTVTDNKVTENGVTWTLTTSGAVGSPTISTGTASSTQGLKFGSSSTNYFGTIKFSTDYFKNYNVKSVTIYEKNNGSKKGTLTVTQGSVTIGTATHSANTSSWATLTASGTTGEGGTLEVTYQVAQASYFNYIEVVYEEAGCTNEITITKADDPANGSFSLDESGKVCIDEGNATVNVTATPNTGYHLETVTSTVGTVGDIDGNTCAITNIGANTTISVTFAENPKYKVSFNVGGSTASQADLTEASAGAGIELPAGPTPTCSADGWTFAGWKETSAVDVETTTAPTLLAAGANYKPAANCTLYAVYKRTESGDVEDQDVTETFENQEAGSTYNSTMDYAASASNANIAWTMYYGCVSSNVKLTGDKSAQMRWYKSATSNLGYIQSTTPISGLQSVSFNAKTDNASSSTVKISVWYSTDGDTWTKVKDNEAAPTATGAISATIDGTVGTDYYVRIGVGDEGTAPTSSSAKLTIDDVQFNFKAAAITTYYLSAPTCSCEQLGKPSVTVTNKTYNSAKLTWAAVDNADKYLVIFNGVDQEATENLYFDATGLEAEETYTYQVKALAEEGQDDYCDGDFSTEASFTTEEAPAATLTLSERGTTHPYPGSHKVGDVVSLPDEAEECSKTFVGWSANASCAVAPEYAPGASYTLAAVSQTLYAVYATPSGSSTWEEIFAVPAAGDYAIYSDGHLMEAAISSNRFQNAAASVTDGKLDDAPAASCIWTVSINASDYFQFKNGTKYASSTSSNNQGALTEDATDTKAQWTIAYSEGFVIENVGRKAAGGNYTLRNNGDYGWGSYGASTGTAPRLFKKMVTYTDFSTSCTAALAKPTFSVDPEDGPFDHVLSVELAAAEGTIYYNINSVDDPTSESTEYDGAITVDACGSTTIKAIAISSTNQSAVASATYVLDMDIPSVSAEDPYTEAEAVEVYNSGCYNDEDVWVTGTVKTAQFYSSNTYTITLTNGFQFYYFYESFDGENLVPFSEDYIEAGDVLVAKGKLGKHNTTYQIANGYLVSRTPAPKTPIDSDIDNPISVAAAINYIDNAATYDLSEDEFVAGIVESIAECPQHEGTYDIIVLDATDNTKQMKFFGCDVKTFAGIKQYDQITGKGKLDKYYSTYELNYPCEVVALTPYVAPVVDVTGVEVDETAIVKVGKTVQLTANVLPANASNKNVTWSVKAGSEAYAEVSATGVVTGKAEGEAIIVVTTEEGSFSDECTVTISGGINFAAGDFVLVEDAAELTEGTYVIVAGSGDNNAAMKYYAGSDNNHKAKTAIKEGKYLHYDADFGVYEIKDYVVEEVKQGISFYNDDAENYFALPANSNQLKVNAEQNNNSSWTVAVSEGVTTLTNKAFTNRTLRYNSGSSCFASYESGQKTIALYKYVTPAAYRVYYNDNVAEEEIEVPAYQSVNGENKVTISAVEPVRDGYLFDGWKDGEANVYEAGVEYTLSADLTLYAQWTTATVSTLSYNPNGGTLISGETAIAPADVAEGTNLTIEANVYEKGDNFVFAGWQLGDDVYQPGDPFVMPATDVEFVAKWDAVEVSDYALVTDLAQLQAGDKIIIVAANLDFAAGAQAGTYRESVAIGKTASKNNLVLAGYAAPTEFTLGISDGKFSFYDGTGYMYEEGEKKVKTQANPYYWTISIDGDAIATIEATNELRYNSSSPRFTTYESGQQTLQLYRKPGVAPVYTEVRNGLNEGEYYTMCLKNAVTAVQGGSIWRVLSKAANDKDIILEEVIGTLDAGRPYIFRATADKLEVACTGVVANAPITTGNNGLIGSFSKAQIAKDDNNYIIYNNMLYLVNSDNVYVGANRAYLDMTGVPAYDNNEPQQGSAPRRRVTMAVHGEQTTTGIDALNAAEAPVKVLINGQMYILRGEKMYNVNGQVVK
jgi:uncharacterized repeat protein (TIGR02543 family)